MLSENWIDLTEAEPIKKQLFNKNPSILVWFLLNICVHKNK